MDPAHDYLSSIVSLNIKLYKLIVDPTRALYSQLNPSIFFEIQSKTGEAKKCSICHKTTGAEVGCAGGGERERGRERAEN
jgi:hypothetical protein